MANGTSPRPLTPWRTVRTRLLAADRTWLLTALLGVQTRVLGVGHPDTLRTRQTLALKRAERRRAEQDYASWRWLQAAETRVWREDDSLTSLGYLEYWRAKLERLDRAVTEFEALLAAQTQALGDDHPDTLSTSSYLASRRVEFEQAVADYERLLADQIRVLGADHPDTLSTRAYLAYCLSKLIQIGIDGPDLDSDAS